MNKKIYYLLSVICYLLSVAPLSATPTERDINAALDAIRKAHNPSYLRFRHADIVADIGAARRTAEMRFRAETGRSILEEINATRLEHAFELLKKPNYPISLVAGECGWQTDAYLKRLFKRTTGLTMHEWRKRCTCRM